MNNLYNQHLLISNSLYLQLMMLNQKENWGKFKTKFITQLHNLMTLKQLNHHILKKVSIHINNLLIHLNQLYLLILKYLRISNYLIDNKVQ
jgi:hypothetical protein